MEHIRRIQQGLLIIAVATLVACGGGDSGPSGPTYTGKTAPAKITKENADELIGANDGTTDTAETSSAGLAPENSNSEPRKRRNRAINLSRVLSRNAKAASDNYEGGSASNTTAAPVATDSTPVDGKCGGTMVTTGTEDDVTFNVDLTVTFNNFCNYEVEYPEDKATLNGVLTIKGSYDEGAGIFNWELATRSLSYKDDADNFTMNGSIVSEGSINSFSVVMNYDFRDNNEGKVYRVENFGVKIIDNNFDGIEGTIFGKLYHPDHGSYALSTDPALLIKYGDEYPSSGIVRVDGADGTFATAEYHSGGTYTLTVYDGTDTTYQTCDSLTGVCAPI